MCKPTRRSFIQLNMKGFLGLSTCMPLLSGCMSQKLSWKEFNKRIKHIADQLNNKELDQKTYLQIAASLSDQLDINDTDLKYEYDKYKNEHDDFPEIRKMHGEETFQISLLEFEPNEEIYLHDHPGMTGVINCVEGNVHVVNYDLLPEKSTDNELLLREVSNVQMKPNDISTLSATHRNIHWLKASTFSRMIDIFAPPYNKQRAEDSKRFEITGTFSHSEKIYKALTV